MAFSDNGRQPQRIFNSGSLSYVDVDDTARFSLVIRNSLAFFFTKHEAEQGNEKKLAPPSFICTAIYEDVHTRYENSRELSKINKKFGKKRI